jgi:transcriptional regulator with XRE-family HTH domain
MSMVNDSTIRNDRLGADSSESSQRLGGQIRALREQQQLSLRTLASRSGFSPSFISQVENGQTSPSIASLERIAQELGVSMGYFFTHPPIEPLVVRAEERPDLLSSWSHARLEMLGRRGPGNTLEAMMLVIEAGGQSGSRPQAHAGEEVAIVFDGEATLTLNGDVHQLHRGDAATLPSGMPHHWHNAGPEQAHIVIVTALSRH